MESKQIPMVLIPSKKILSPCLRPELTKASMKHVYFLYTRGLYSSSNVHSEIRKIDSITQVANTASFDGMTLELGLDGNNEVTAATGST